MGWGGGGVSKGKGMVGTVHNGLTGERMAPWNGGITFHDEKGYTTAPRWRFYCVCLLDT